MKRLPEIFKKNKEWTKKMEEERPGFFSDLSKQQYPKYLWIGCADSRVPATQICGMDPGEIFVHRNISNVVDHTDFNFLSVLQFAVDTLKVEHIIISGHYGCGGVLAAMGEESNGLVDNWLRHVKDVYYQNQAMFEKIDDEEKRCDLLVELNVKTQVLNTCKTTIVQEAWKRGHNLSVHGWVYSLETGLLQDLDFCIDGPRKVSELYSFTL